MKVHEKDILGLGFFDRATESDKGLASSIDGMDIGRDGFGWIMLNMVEVLASLKAA
jgi:hypothetical protein